MILSAFQYFWNTKISNFDSIKFGQENILRFHIPMKNFSGVNIIQSQAQLDKPVHNLSFSE
jgi:hypothetical protein